ncbi:MAG: hypothetical protein ACJ0IZ_03870 [Verrucomicrobiales bacterium]|nr:hypothetical protein [Verrucomicrobiales bacterium]
MEALLGITAFLLLPFSIGACVGSIMLIVHGFKKDTTWGILNLLVPFAAIVFMFKYPEEAQPGRKITLISLVGLLVCFLVGLLGVASVG